MESRSADPAELSARVRAGDRAAWNALFDRHRARLRRMVEIRLDARLQARVEALDLVQEAHLEVAQRLEEYLRDPKLPPFLWLRLVVGERLMKLHRHHLGAQMRDAGREVSLFRGALPAASSAALAARLLGRQTSPTQAILRAERKIRLQEALNRMDPLDREILVLRHYEQMTNGDAAAALGLEKSAASKRYTRALARLKEILAALRGAISEEGS
jgi:RNA polymerase sigma-70 factor (ECF subfamily)